MNCVLPTVYCRQCSQELTSTTTRRQLDFVVRETKMNTLVIDIGGTNVKLWKTGEPEKTKSHPASDSHRKCSSSR